LTIAVSLSSARKVRLSMLPPWVEMLLMEAYLASLLVTLLT